MILKKNQFYLIIIVITITAPSFVFSQNTLIPIDVLGMNRLMSDTDCPVMVIASAAWCAPCRKELPILNRLFIKYRDQGLRMSALSLDVSQKDMQRIVDQMNLEFPVYWGGDTMAKHYNIFGMPTILLIKDGKVQERFIGKRSEALLEKIITDLLKSCKP